VQKPFWQTSEAQAAFSMQGWPKSNAQRPFPSQMWSPAQITSGLTALSPSYVP
jgi:hypothetical protein